MEMKLEIKIDELEVKIYEFVTEIHGLRDMADLPSISDRIGSPALLMVYPEDNVFCTDDVWDFFMESPFITATVGKGIPDHLIDFFDLKIKEEDAEGYAEKLFKDKTRRQVDLITACFVAARKEASEEELLRLESETFYRLMADKNGGAV